MKNELTVIILTKNEENNILDCLEGLSNASEIIVLDDNSTDRTVEVIGSLKKKNVKISEHPLDSDFSKQRNYGLEKAKNEWVLYVDADERVSRELFSEILNKINEDKFDGFFIKRKDVMWDKELKHGETGNVRLVRLAKKGLGKWEGSVHEVWDIKGKIGELENELMHYPHPTLKEFLREINMYSTIRANDLKNEGVSSSLWQIIAYPKAKFILNYIVKMGFLDGIPGLIVAIMMSFHSFLVRAKLWQRYQKQ